MKQSETMFHARLVGIQGSRYTISKLFALPNPDAIDFLESGVVLLAAFTVHK